jgi:glutathione S-transferase
MAEMITLWGRLSSINVQKVAWALDELGLAYTHVDAGGDAGGLDEPAFRAMNPHGRVPVLKDGDTVMWESNAVVRYLYAAHGPPAAPGERAMQDRWMDWTLAELQPAMMGLFWRWYRTPAAMRDERVVERLARDSAAAFAVLDRWLETRDWLAGDAFSMADVPAGTLLFRYFEMGRDPPRPRALMAWYERLRARGAYQRQIMRPFEALFGRLAF